LDRALPAVMRRRLDSPTGQGAGYGEIVARLVVVNVKTAEISCFQRPAAVRRMG
jgi:hypothetical protein